MEKKSLAEKLNKKYHKALEITDLKDLLYKSATRYTRRAAFKLKDKIGNIYKVTYEKFRKDVMALGTALINLGLKDEYIAVTGKNSYNWAVSYLAATIVGIVVPIDKELKSEDIINFLNVSSSKAILGDDKYITELISKKAEITNKNTLFINFNSKKDTNTYMSYSLLLDAGYNQLEEGNKDFDNIKIDPDAMKILIFTSGTTGNAKGVCLSHKNIVSNIMSTFGIVKVKRSDQVLSILPLHHTYECTLGFLLVIYSGGCISYCEGLRHITKNILEFKPTVILCVPLLLEKMYKKIEATVRKSLPEKYANIEGNIIANLPSVIKKIVKTKVKNSLGGRLRAFIVGAAPLSPDIITSYKNLNIKSIQGYGLTECSPLVAGNNDFYINPDAVGLPIPNVSYKIDKPDNSGVGEILVKGPNVMLGYYENPEATKAVLKDGWFHTGDLGYYDKDGYLYITGRKKEVIVLKNGENVYPSEIEFLVNQLPYVVESIVFPRENSKGEISLGIKIVYDEAGIKEKFGDKTQKEYKNLIWEDIKEINQNLSQFKKLKEVIITTEPLEKTTTQKVKRFKEIEKILAK
jgi:long-chain acyl-CoA synthetase